MISGDQGAYTYLPESIAVFPEGEQFLDFMREAGFEELDVRRLTFGVASMYSGRKSTDQG